MNILANNICRMSFHRRIQFRFVVEERVFGEHILVIRAVALVISFAD